MIILNAGIPRSGTVLVNAIMRELFRLAGREIRQENPTQQELPTLIGSLQKSGADASETVVIHTHTCDGETTRLLRGNRNVRGTLNFRDPRDVCISLMRLHDHDLEKSALNVEAYVQHFFATAASVNLMLVPYELLVFEKRTHIFQIARQLGLWPSMAAVEQVNQLTSIDRHREVMEKVRAGRMPELTIRRNSKRDLVEDPQSLINDRHIQSGTSGRWRQELDEDAQKALTERFAPVLKRLGYAP